MISVIICTYNRSAILQGALDSVAEMQVPKEFDWELLIVDNNSTDRTREVVEQFAKRAPMRVRYVVERKQGLSHARNCGIRHARGEILAFTDDDVTLDPNWLLHIGETFDVYGCMAVGGKIIPVWPCPKPAWFSEDAPYDISGPIVKFDLGEEICETRKEPFGANMAFRKEAFTKYGLFRVDLGRSKGVSLGGEEIELFRRLIAGQEKIVYTPKAVVFHPVFKERIQKQHFQAGFYHWGRAKARLEDTLDTLEAVRCFGVPRYLFRKLAVTFMRWVTTFEAKQRFFHKLAVWELAGRIVENFALHRKMVREREQKVAESRPL